MPDKENAEQFVEPTSDRQRAGEDEWVQQPTPYVKFMGEEGVPIYRGIGFRDVHELDLGDWDRMGARGAYLRLDALDDFKGMYVLEIPGRGATIPERHIYHEFYLIVEGRGTTETWSDERQKRTFEWRPGSLFMLPPNVNHRLVNATNERVLIIATTNLPPIINIFRDRGFIFGNDYPMSKFYSDDAEFFKYDENLYVNPVNKRAQARTNYYPDIANCELPLDNQRAPGYRRIQPGWTGLEDSAYTAGFIAQYPPGRYSRAHCHVAHAVLVCLRGRGYSFTWHESLGTTPWKDGNGDKVKSLEYVPGGLIAAAPGGAAWFHQHFGVSREPFRVLNYGGGPVPSPHFNFPGEEGERLIGHNVNISKGGKSIGYAVEDPYIREKFQAALSAEGLESQMPSDVYVSDT